MSKKSVLNVVRDQLRRMAIEEVRINSDAIFVYISGQREEVKRLIIKDIIKNTYPKEELFRYSRIIIYFSKDC